MFIVNLIIAAIEADSLYKKFNFKIKKGTLTFIMWVINMIVTPFTTIGLWIVLSFTGLLDTLSDVFNAKSNINNNIQQDQNQYQNPYYNSFSQPGIGTTGRYQSQKRAYSRSSKAYSQPGYSSSPFSRVKSANVSNPYNLPRTEAARSKLINKFNKKFDLNLTNTDVKTISSATYMSLEWASEVYAMEQKYDSVYEWLGQGNIWLRVYLYAFNIQNISPVFNKQEELVYNAFNTIFSEMCYDESLPTEVIIENINNKYMTRFDEASFLLAINYMEGKGRHFKFGSPVLTRVSSDVDDLVKKYGGTPMR